MLCDGQHVGGPDGACAQFSSAVDACVSHSGKGADEESKQRDIPMPLVTSGVETGSLRQLALQRLADLVWEEMMIDDAGTELPRHPNEGGGHPGDSQEDPADKSERK